MHQSNKAKIAYEKAMLQGGLKGKYLLGYGHTLKALGKYNEARKIYEEFGQSNPVVGEYFARSCDVALSYIDGDVSYIESDFDYNTILSDKALTYNNGKLIISSFEKSKFDAHTKEWLKSEGELLSLHANLGAAPTRVRVDMKEHGDINAITYSADNALCVVSKTTNSTNFSPVIENEAAKSLFVSREVSSNGDFDNEKAFLYNKTGYSTTHPSLSKDGKTLYFSSNRPGGFGGFDIYVSTFKNGLWTKPQNLGNVINSKGNEITPNIAFDGNLWFASDYHIGLGGYDVFKSKNVNNEWTNPNNIGKNVNTASDDYMPVLDFTGNLKFVTSNRPGSKGGSDIYELTPVSHEEILASVEVSDPVSIDNDVLNDENETQPIFVMNDQIDFEIQEIETLDIDEDTEAIYVANEDEMPKAYVIPSYRSSVMDRDPNLKSVAITTRAKVQATAYFVQLASISRHNGDFSIYRNASTLGNVYKIFKNNLVKIRVGYFDNKNDAKRVLSQLKQKGYRDAFITSDNLNMEEIELIYSSFDNNYTESNSNDIYQASLNTNNSAGTNYKVRLAAYDNPLFFDVAAVRGIAKLEQWSKGDWTIFLLGGFKSLEEAESAKIKAINRGFIDAYIVVDNGGVLEKLSRN